MILDFQEGKTSLTLAVIADPSLVKDSMNLVVGSAGVWITLILLFFFKIVPVYVECMRFPHFNQLAAKRDLINYY